MKNSISSSDSISGGKSTKILAALRDADCRRLIKHESLANTLGIRDNSLTSIGREHNPVDGNNSTKSQEFLAVQQTVFGSRPV